MRIGLCAPGEWTLSHQGFQTSSTVLNFVSDDS